MEQSEPQLLIQVAIHPKPHVPKQPLHLFAQSLPQLEQPEHEPEQLPAHPPVQLLAHAPEQSPVQFERQLDDPANVSDSRPVIVDSRTSISGRMSPFSTFANPGISQIFNASSIRACPCEASTLSFCTGVGERGVEVPAIEPFLSRRLNSAIRRFLSAM